MRGNLATDSLVPCGGSALTRCRSEAASRHLGVGISNLAPASDCDPTDLIDDGAGKRAAAERAMDKVRAKFGREVVGKGRGMKREP